METTKRETTSDGVSNSPMVLVCLYLVLQENRCPGNGYRVGTLSFASYHFSEKFQSQPLVYTEAPTEAKTGKRMHSNNKVLAWQARGGTRTGTLSRKDKNGEKRWGCSSP